MTAELTREQLIDWLVEWRQTMKGSVSPENHRRLLAARRTPELRMMVRRIVQTHEWFTNLERDRRTR
jgi:hypothetical protein